LVETGILGYFVGVHRIRAQAGIHAEQVQALVAQSQRSRRTRPSSTTASAQALCR
jgi:hypothetical protein